MPRIHKECTDGMCGALDCARCRPRCHDEFECCECGAVFERWEGYGVFCAGCGGPVCTDCSDNAMHPASAGMLCTECYTRLRED